MNGQLCSLRNLDTSPAIIKLQFYPLLKGANTNWDQYI